MKKSFILIILAFLFGLQIFGQTGYTCLTPDVIASLPFVSAGMTTAGSGNDYDGSACGSANYLSGEDYVFTYTPTSNQNISIELTNTGVMVGLFIMDGCPDATPNCIDYIEASFGNPAIGNIALTSGTTYYIIVSTYNLFGSNPSTAFDIEINELIQLDAAVVKFNGPKSSCSLSNSETIIVTIYNFGLQSINNFDVSYSINSGAPVTETVTATILPDTFLLYSFTTVADFSTPSTEYEILSYTSLIGDGNTLNDDFTGYVLNQPVVNSFPYSEDFESGHGFWQAYGDNSTWKLGAPAATIINSAASGTQAWATNLIGNHGSNELSYLESTCFDFSGLTNPKIEFSIWYETTMILGTAILFYSLDEGMSWDTLKAGSANSNWYNMGNTWTGSSAGWLTAYNTVPILSGNSNVKFRFELYGGFIAAEGIAIDDFSVSECSSAVPVAGFTYNTTGTSVTFNNTSTDATSYYWDFGQIMGTSTDQNPTYDYLIDGSYTVTMIAMNDCFSDTVIQIIDIVTNIQGIDPDNDFCIFPNPADKYLNIQTNNYCKFEIIDIKGVIMTEGQISDKCVVNISTFEKGIYLIRVIENQNVFIKKLIIE
ncbi:MAG: T9SS type A sorting domain-containing protein [Bacteroidota bacterium]